MLSHYLSFPLPNTLCMHTTCRNQKKMMYAYMCCIQGAFFLLSALRPSSSWTNWWCSRKAAVMRCTRDFSQVTIPRVLFKHCQERVCLSVIFFFPMYLLIFCYRSCLLGLCFVFSCHFLKVQYF